MNRGRKVTGGKYHKLRKKKKHTRKSQERVTTLAETKRKTIRKRGGGEKVILLNADEANLVDQKGKVKKVKIENVIETPQNRFFARSNILMKGAIIQTSEGKAKITNRPSQEGCVNAVLLKEQKTE